MKLYVVGVYTTGMDWYIDKIFLSRESAVTYLAEHLSNEVIAYKLEIYEGKP